MDSHFAKIRQIIAISIIRRIYDAYNLFTAR
jgi:hypothetical protein